MGVLGFFIGRGSILVVEVIVGKIVGSEGGGYVNMEVYLGFLYCVEELLRKEKKSIRVGVIDCFYLFGIEEFKDVGFLMLKLG